MRGPPGTAQAGEVSPIRDQRPHLELTALRAGYGTMEIVHGIDLAIGYGESLCLVGPNGAGKSTILHSLFRLADVLGGRIVIDGRDVTRVTARTLLLEAKVAYVPQAYSVFPEMSVADNLLLGGHVLPGRHAARLAAERIFDTHPWLANRRKTAAGALSGGERRQLELARALMTEPRLLLVDEPSIGLDPKGIEAVFETLSLLQHRDGLSVLMVEQNVRKGLAFADYGALLVAGRLVMRAPASQMRDDPRIGQTFLGS